MDCQDKIIKPIEYCLYARKSSESDERQAMSIDSQINEMRLLADKDKSLIKEILFESHSAKESGQRHVFKQLITDIIFGKYNGILTWNPDRLSRNAGDLGILVDLMDQGKLIEIKTYSHTFKNTPNDKFLLMILCSQAKLENDNKGINVKRGIKTRCEMGWRPSGAPLGYINRTLGGVSDIIIDKERALLIKQAFEKVAYLNQKGRTIKAWLDESGFKTRNNKSVTLSMVYHLLKNPFYYGSFEYPVGSGNWFKGKHEPLISKELFNQVQKIICDPNKKSYIGRQFDFRKLFTCYSCGSGICGEEKLRKLKNGGKRRHIYYHCTRSKNRNCKEAYIEERELIVQILKVIKKIPDKKIVISDSLKNSMKKYEKILMEANYLSKYNFDGELNMRDYIEYIIRQGTMSERQELLSTIIIPKRLNNKKLV